jgi:hypothetical protein
MSVGPRYPSGAGSTLATFHADAPPSGCRELITSPAPSTPTHSDTDGHEIAVLIMEELRSWTSCQLPEAGCAVTAIWPDPENATHSDTDGHDTAGPSPFGNTGRGALHAPGLPGRCVTLTSLSVNATQSDGEGQSTEDTVTCVALVGP